MKSVPCKECGESFYQTHVNQLYCPKHSGEHASYVRSMLKKNPNARVRTGFCSDCGTELDNFYRLRCDECKRLNRIQSRAKKRASMTKTQRGVEVVTECKGCKKPVQPPYHYCVDCGGNAIEYKRRERERAIEAILKKVGRAS